MAKPKLDPKTLRHIAKHLNKSADTWGRAAETAKQALGDYHGNRKVAHEMRYQAAQLLTLAVHAEATA